MKISINHPGEMSLECINNTITRQEVIRRSPHVGNINPKELGVILGMASMKAKVEVELVDTIQGNDSYSLPHKLITSNSTESLCSKRAAKGVVVGKCRVTEDFAGVSLPIEISPGDALLDVHVRSLKSIMPRNVKIGLTSQLFASIGNKTLDLVLKKTIETIDRPTRSIDTEGKVCQGVHPDSDEIFGTGENPLIGTLPPLEAMMAIECLKAVIDSSGSDTQLIHVAGPDMIRYTKEPKIMDPVQLIVDKVCAELGVFHNTTIDYVLPCMATLLNDNSFPQMLPNNDVQTQYDMLELRS